MSTDQQSHENTEDEETTFKQRCERIANDEEVNDDIRHIARGLLADIEAGDLDAN